MTYRWRSLPIYGGPADVRARAAPARPCLEATSGIGRCCGSSSGEATSFGSATTCSTRCEFLLSDRAAASNTRTFPRSTSTSRCCATGSSAPESRSWRFPRARPATRFVVCLTHDIDFVGIRHHMFDHTMWGFLYRSTVGAVRNLCRRQDVGPRVCCEIWRAAASLPFVYLGWAQGLLGAVRVVPATSRRTCRRRTS